jgi:hypothetical protein
VLSPNDKEILNNLKFAQKRTIDEVKVIPKVGFESCFCDFTYHYNTWGWIAYPQFFLLVFWAITFQKVR